MDHPTALITGASSGIGRELARVFAEHGHDLIVTARREECLAELADSLPSSCRVDVIAMDLTTAKGPDRLVAEIDRRGLAVGVLVNNAGAAARGPFHSLSARQMRQILGLNVSALAALTQAVLPGMIERGRGRVLNVASVAAFQPVPGMSLYSASKAFVLSFTESLSEDLRGTGITVTALCPGLTRTPLLDDLKTPELPAPLVSSAREVALEGYRACMAGEVIRIPGVMNQALVGWMQHQPRWLLRTVSGMVARSAAGRA